jgi:hypothetical protein
MTTTADYNSTTNQNIKGKLVQREVFANVGQMAEFCLQQSTEGADSPIQWEEIENLYKYPDFSGNYVSVYTGLEDDIQEAKDSLEEMLDSDEYTEEQKDAIQLELEELNELEQEPQDVFEWWIVSDYLAEKLKERGEVIASDGWNSIWGRTTTGQAILLDYVISQIAEEMEILEGMANDWSK